MNPASSGDWEVFVFIPSAGTTNNGTYVITHNGTNDTVMIDQAANQNKWVSLGVFNFAGHGEEYITLSSNTGEPNGQTRVAYDAVGIKWVGEQESDIPNCSLPLGAIILFTIVGGLSKRRSK